MRWLMKGNTIGPVEEGLGSGEPLDDYQAFDVTALPSISKFDKSKG